MHRCTVALVLLLACMIAGCDSHPGDPLDPRTDLAPLLRGSGDAAASGLSLPGLVYAAVHRVHQESGPLAARALVAELRRVQEDANAVLNGAPETSASRLRAVQLEELRIVLRVFGPPIVERVVESVRRDVNRLEFDLAQGEADGRVSAGWQDGVARVRAGIERAAQLGQRDALGALEAATHAAAAAEALHLLLDAGRRVSGLEELFDHAVSRLRDRDEAAEAVAAVERLQRAGEMVAATGDRLRAHEAAKAARDEQIRFVLAVLGEDAVAGLLEDAAAARVRLDTLLRHERRSGRDLARIERMSAGAGDMLSRAGAALQAGDAATALDLASHAAGLINAARAAITY